MATNDNKFTYLAPIYCQARGSGQREIPDSFDAKGFMIWKERELRTIVAHCNTADSDRGKPKIL